MTDEPDLVQNAIEDDERYRAYLKEAEVEHYELMSIEHYKSAFEANPFIHLNDCSTCHSPVVIRCDGYMDSGRAKIFLYVRCDKCGNEAIGDGSESVLAEKWNAANVEVCQ